MPNATNNEEQLQDLFSSEMGQEHFTALSRNLGFSLSVYSQQGTLIFAPPGPFPLCPEFSSAHSSFTSNCDAECLTRALNTLSTKKPEVFQCHSKIVSFALPLEYEGDWVVILGQGSFSSYKDFRDYMKTVYTDDLDTMSIPVPTSFTSYEQAWKVCGFVEDSVKRLFKNASETASIRKKFERLKDMIGFFGAPDDERPEAPYEQMISKLALLLEIEHIAILTEKKKEGVYTNRPVPPGERGTKDIVSISHDDAVVSDLMAGKAFVSFPAPQRGPVEGSPGARREARYLFPIMINNKLESILYTAGRDLTEWDRQVVSAFCRQAALSLENRRLQYKLARKFERFAAISELTRSITSIQNYETLTRTVLDLSAQLLMAEQGSLMLVDQKTDGLFLEAKKGDVAGLSNRLRINRGEGIAGRVAENGVPILVEDLENDPRIRQKNRHHYKTRSFVSVPLKIDNRIIGVLNLSDKISGDVFDEDDLKLIQSFVTHAAIVMERQMIINNTEELKKLTITDPLTGLLNRRYLSERLKNELARSERHLHPLCLLMLDLDGFKKCNDSRGHLFGDSILKNIAEILYRTVRSMDIVARYGGDEFMVILPETGEPMAIDIAERVRRNIMRKVALPPEVAGPETHTLTASIGVVCFPEHGDTVERLLANVDEALYRAKKNGKNRIEVYRGSAKQAAGKLPCPRAK